jgi:hypothetical protein
MTEEPSQTNGQPKKKHPMFDDNDDVFPVRDCFRNILLIEFDFLFAFRIIHKKHQIQNRVEQQQRQRQVKQLQVHQRVA